MAAPTDPPPTPGTVPTGPSVRAQPAAPSLATGPSGLRLAVNERGRISRSISAVASSDASGTALAVQKPAGATVRKAYMATATTGGTGRTLSVPLQVDGQDVALGDPTPSGISSYNYFAEVTALVKANVDAAAAGAVPVTITEPEPDLTDGEIVVVVFTTRPCASTAPCRSCSVRCNPAVTATPSTELEMSLGISYSFQQNGTQQFSTVDVNGTRMTSAAGGEDDGYSANGGLVTVGGNGDSRVDPVDPNAPPTQPRSDDELYDLRPFMHHGDSSIAVTTNNPSLDDNVLLATFTMNPPVTGITTAGGDKYVEVALGDSHQSGEGTGFGVRPQAAYRNAYEPHTYLGDQPEDPSGDGCHRSMQNYANVNRDLYKPGATVVIVRAAAPRSGPSRRSRRSSAPTARPWTRSRRSRPPWPSSRRWA